LVPLYLSRGIWILLDIIAAAFIFWFLSLKPDHRDDLEGQNNTDHNQALKPKSSEFGKVAILSSVLMLAMAIFFTLIK
jgi:hypothetical protein